MNWTSKFRSVITTAYDLSTSDGMNSQGLVVNLLYLDIGDYGKRNISVPVMSLANTPWTTLPHRESR